MEQLKCLVLDNEPHWLGQLVDTLARIQHITVSQQSRASAAIDVARKEHFDICFIDLILQEPPTGGSHLVYEGVGVIESIRPAKHMAIVAYSTAFEEGKETMSSLYEPCVKAGADAVIARTTLHTMPANTLVDRIQAWVEERRSKVSRPLKVASDLPTRAAVERIGSATIQLLLSELLPGMTEDRIAAISGGYSGSIVFDVSSRTAGNLHVDTKNVEKVSQSSYALHNELARRPMIGTHFSALAPAASVIPSKTINGWTAAAFGKILDREPLGLYLTRTKTSTAVKGALDRVVSSIYIRSAIAAEPLAAGTHVDSEYRFSLSAAAALDAALEQLISSKEIVGRADRAKAASVRRFLHELVEGKATLVAPSGLFALLHGDLHADNVFISDKTDAMLIDFERSDVYPRLFDIAALDVDLVLRRIDSLAGAPLDFDRVDRWEEQVVQLFPFNGQKSHGPRASRTRAGLLRELLLSRIRSDVAGVTPAEYATALLFQLMRYLKFESVSLPRRVLGVRLAVRLIRRLGIA